MKDTIVNDAELVLLLETGDEHAFQEIYDRYWHKLYRMAVGKVGSQENAKELVQDVFLDLWFRRGEVHIGELDRYLFSAVKYNVLNFIRKEIVRKQYELSVFAKTPDTDCNTEDALAFQELQQAIMTGIDQLPPKVGHIFRLNRIEHRSVGEISELLKMPERTVEYHITQALRLMRGYLKDYMVYLLISYLAYIAPSVLGM